MGFVVNHKIIIVPRYVHVLLAKFYWDTLKASFSKKYLVGMSILSFLGGSYLSAKGFTLGLHSYNHYVASVLHFVECLHTYVDSICTYT